MQLNGAFVLREIMGDHVIVPIQSAESKFSGLITLNDAGVFLWSQLECVPDEETLCRKFYEAYEVDRYTAKKDVPEFLQRLRECGILKEE